MVPYVALVLAAMLAGAGASPPAKVKSGHEQAVLELFETMRLEETMAAGATAMIDAQIQGSPEIAPYRDVMVGWAKKHLSFANFAPRLLPMYMEAFTEPEVRELLRFYRSPVGKKTLTSMPDLMQKGALLGAEIANEHQADLEQMVLERKKQLDAESPPGP